MYRNSVRIAAALALAFSAAGALAQAPDQDRLPGRTVRPARRAGQDQYDGFMLVVERNGGKLGGVPVQVLKEDDQLKPDVAMQIVQKLIEKENVLDHHRPHRLQRDDGGAQADHREAGVPDRQQRRPVADRRRAVLAVPVHRLVAERRPGRGGGQVRHRQGLQEVIGMAPNYQAGKDFIAGFKRYYKGEVIDEIYTPLNQPDFSAEMAQVAAAKPDAVYVFYPGGLGVNFVRQYQQAGLLGKIPLLSSMHHRRHDAAGAEGDRAGRHLRHLLGPGPRQPGEQAVRRGVREEVQPHSRRSSRRRATTRRCCSTRRSPRSRATWPTRRPSRPR